MKRLIFGVAASALMAIGAASAADMVPVYKAPPVAAPGYDWTGFYIGANGGYGWRDPSIDFSGNTAAEATYFASGALSRGVAVDPKGFLGGLQAGYNQQLGRWVLGVEADLDYARIHDAGSAATGVGISPNQGACFVGLPCTVNTYQYNISGEQKLDAFGTLRGRGGVVVGDRLLLFATGGLAFGEAKLAAAVTNTSGVAVTTLNNAIIAGPNLLPGSCFDICATGLASQWLVGWTIGGGFEYGLDDRWSIKAEYLYYDLGRLSVAFSDPHFAPYSFNASADYAGHIARVGVNFKLH
jgi:outer membrane immunogenic protein